MLRIKAKQNFLYSGASFAGCHPSIAMVLLTIAVGSNGIIYSGEQSAMLDIANNFAGTLMGIINALGNTMGFLAPLLTGLIINHHNNVTRWKVCCFSILTKSYVPFSASVLDCYPGLYFWEHNLCHLWNICRTEVEQSPEQDSLETRGLAMYFILMFKY